MNEGEGSRNLQLEEQAHRNLRSRHAWEQYRAHRERVTELLVPPATPARPARLCVLGAGNCNDIDLGRLADCYQQMHLVDLDEEALEFAVERQPPDVRRRLVTHGGVDVTGALTALDGPPPLGEVNIDGLARSLSRQIALDLPAPFQAVASVGLLSQLIDTLASVVGRSHPRLLEAIAALRGAHLRLLADLLAPGGRAVLVTELVSSDTFPELPQVAEAALPSVLGQLVAKKNFFTGANPAVLKGLLESEPLNTVADAVEFTLPWRWEFVDRMYAVYGATFVRR